MEMKDSGKRQQFEGGAVRDSADGKPAMSLLSPHVYDTCVLIDDAMEYDMDDLIDRHEFVSGIAGKVALFMTLGSGSGPGKGKTLMQTVFIDLVRAFGYERLCNWLSLGAQKYSRFNWAKGMTFSRVVDSLLRHLTAVGDGVNDEDHGAACCCNAMFLYHYLMEIDAGRLDPKWDDRFDFAMYEDPCHAIPVRFDYAPPGYDYKNFTKPWKCDQIMIDDDNACPETRGVDRDADVHPCVEEAKNNVLEMIRKIAEEQK